MYSKTKNYFREYLEEKAPRLLRLMSENKIGLKYIASGGLAALFNIILLYMFTDWLGLWYLISSVTVYVISTTLNFALLKFWAFRDPDWRKLYKQLAIFTPLATINFFISPSLLVFFVEVIGFWYITGQLIVFALLALTNFIVNKKIIFRGAEG